MADFLNYHMTLFDPELEPVISGAESEAPRQRAGERFGATYVGPVFEPFEKREDASMDDDGEVIEGTSCSGDQSNLGHKVEVSTH